MHIRNISRCLALSSVLFASVLVTSSCDTVALISFQERDFEGVNVIGLSPLSSSCEKIDGKGNFRFVLLADDATAIRPGEAVGRTEVSLETKNLKFNETAVGDLPDKACKNEDDCEHSAEAFTCSGETGISSKRCLRDAKVGVSGSVQFESDTTKNRLFGVLVENSGSVEGWLPEDLGGKFPDTNKDGSGDGGEDVGKNASRGSDTKNRRKSSLPGLISSWENSKEAASRESRKTLFGLWEFSGQTKDEVKSLVAQVGTKKEWTDSKTFANDARTKFSQVRGTRANVYQAIDKILSYEENGEVMGFATAEYADYDKTLIVVLDGPDDLRRPNFSPDTIVTKAKKIGVKIYFVHFDSGVKTKKGEQELFRDDTFYWNGTVSGNPIQTPCSDDDACLNFESCREPQLFASTRDASVEVPGGYKTGDKYCLPLRKEDGRFGPVHDYATIACETSGGYLYSRDARAIRQNINWLPFTMDGVWSVETTVNVFEDKLVPSDREGYLLQTSFSVELGSRSRTTELSRVGRSNSVEAAGDTRLPIFN